ncbi:hypothetical protein A9G34_07550 [Gilliamella sp. Choc4-2]|jgi:uncharacterized protein|uniref:hypothetical protein n=1 Tax=unclassified Gilliamella TaxID=2685620 RepID=UPI0004DD3D5C|nr:hypothetical protein [Gilliamella apicola]KFA58865.1 hypothetical protein GAPWKB11_0754 [Gilliamella apicola]OCG31824.1 hypothetical protein A9G33_04630 [Gilliamella apicola]OCG43837.1 hypothetical protein A9G34_07550 [Gilliamella apicola]OCG54913.1 hypothetical protein A9G36_06930 [Gilliamella apicola]OCG64940.1 hypothetical protein A9G48_01555 [Gilliamella apicola]
MKADKKIITFIQKHHVLSLSVILPDANLWACNAFYVFNEDLMCLYILTELTTDHGNAMLNHAQVAGTISLTPKTVAKIQGIQFQAIALQLIGNKAKQAYSLYYQKFPFARIIKAPIWSLELQRIKMTDNLMGFAHKIHWVKRNLYK